MAVQTEPIPPSNADIRTALVTGGSNGIGRATAELFAQNGFEVVVWGQDPERLAEVGEIEGIVVADRVDVRDLDQVEAALARTFGDSGRPLEALVQSAGAIDLDSFAGASVDQAMADWEHMREANLDSVVRVTKAALRYILRPGGSITTISSQAGSDAAGFSWAYTAAKAGVNGLTRALAKELGPQGIRVNAIAPGFIADTGMTGWIDDATEAAQAAQIPLRRNGTVRDIAAEALHLVNSPFTTGQVNHVNGGVYFD